MCILNAAILQVLPVLSCVGMGSRTWPRGDAWGVTCILHCWSAGVVGGRRAHLQTISGNRKFAVAKYSRFVDLKTCTGLLWDMQGGGFAPVASSHRHVLRLSFRSSALLLSAPPLLSPQPNSLYAKALQQLQVFHRDECDEDYAPTDNVVYWYLQKRE